MRESLQTRTFDRTRTEQPWNYSYESSRAHLYGITYTKVHVHTYMVLLIREITCIPIWYYLYESSRAYLYGITYTRVHVHTYMVLLIRDFTCIPIWYYLYKSSRAHLYTYMVSVEHMTSLHNLPTVLLLTRHLPNPLQCNLHTTSYTHVHKYTHTPGGRAASSPSSSLTELQLTACSMRTCCRSSST
jgi:hypothetical protein